MESLDVQNLLSPVKARPSKIQKVSEETNWYMELMDWKLQRDQEGTSSTKLDPDLRVSSELLLQ